MKIKKIKILGSFVMILALLASPAYAMSGGGWCAKGQGEYEERMQKKMDKILSELGLSEAQLKKIEDQRKLQKEAREKSFLIFREKMEALKTALDAPETDRAKIKSLADELSALEDQKIRQRIDMVLAIKEILTPEQFVQLRVKKEEMFKEFKGKRKHGHGHSEAKSEAQ